jgi:anti-sigma regulatory factor (Ser/Thr protein kinase)
VTVSFTPLPAHVRTARFIAASVARRAGLPEPVLDEIRLAVSEACSLAVRFHVAQAPTEPVELRLIESGARFSVQVADSVYRPAPDRAGDLALDLEQVDLLGQERIGLAVISGLVDDVTFDYGTSGSVVTMTWPIGENQA